MTETEHQKKMIVPEARETIAIPLNVRFAIIKRANGKCEHCTRLIKDHPIEAYPIDDIDKNRIGFYAICKVCKEKLKDKIVYET